MPFSKAHPPSKHKNLQDESMEEDDNEEEHAAATLLAALPLLPSHQPNEEEEEEGGGSETRRSVCYDGCGRPSSVCICPFLPHRPIPTSTQIILLHHPHSLKSHPLSTLPPLLSSLLRLSILPGRRLRLGSHPLLDHLFHLPPSPLPPALFLFPSLPSSPSPTPLPLWAHRTPPSLRTSPVLVSFDGTWTQAREMASASLPFLSKFATHVTIGDLDEGAEGPSGYESELVVRKEPFKGCVSTMEAVARALRVIEPDERVGAEVERTLIGILKAMAGFQARHLKPMKARVRTRKKKEMKDDQQKARNEACSG